MKLRSVIRGRRASRLSSDTARTAIGRCTRRAAVRGTERPFAAQPTLEQAGCGMRLCSGQNEQGAKLLDELKGLVDSFPQDKSKQIIAALKEIFSELDGGAADSAHRGA